MFASTSSIRRAFLFIIMKRFLTFYLFSANLVIPMAVPKRRTTRTKRNMRRSHHGVQLLQFVRDSQTGQAVLPHMANPTTGKYKGREVINVLKKVERHRKKAGERNQA